VLRCAPPWRRGSRYSQRRAPPYVARRQQETEEAARRQVREVYAGSSSKAPNALPPRYAPVVAGMLPPVCTGRRGTEEQTIRATKEVTSPAPTMYASGNVAACGHAAVRALRSTPARYSTRKAGACARSEGGEGHARRQASAGAAWRRARYCVGTKRGFVARARHYALSSVRVDTYACAACATLWYACLPQRSVACCYGRRRAPVIARRHV